MSALRIYVIFAVLLAGLSEHINSYVSPLCNRVSSVGGISLRGLRPRIVRSSSRHTIASGTHTSSSVSRIHSNDADDIFGDFGMDPPSQQTAVTSSSTEVASLEAAATGVTAEVEDINAAHQFDMGENSAENDRSSDGVVEAANDVSELSNSIEERIPAYALLYKFQSGFTIVNNPLTEEHEKYCEKFVTPINSELLALDEDVNGAVVLWGSMNGTTEGKTETLEEIRNFRKNDPLNDMMEEFEIIDLSPEVPASFVLTPGRRSVEAAGEGGRILEDGGSSPNGDGIASNLERFRHLEDLNDDTH